VEQRDDVTADGGKGQQGHDERADVVVEVEEAGSVEPGADDEKSAEDRPYGHGSASAPEVARVVREFLTERVWANRPGTAEEETMKTTALVSSQLLGVAWARYVVRMEPLATALRAEVAAWVGPAIEGYLAGGRETSTSGSADKRPTAP
jgi:hypothetical protein